LGAANLFGGFPYLRAQDPFRGLLGCATTEGFKRKSGGTLTINRSAYKDAVTTNARHTHSPRCSSRSSRSSHSSIYPSQPKSAPTHPLIYSQAGTSEEAVRGRWTTKISSPVNPSICNLFSGGRHVAFPPRRWCLLSINQGINQSINGSINGSRHVRCFTNACGG